LTFRRTWFNVEHMKDELFQNESLLDILDDIASFRGDYRFGSSHSRFDRERGEQEDDQENTESDHFSFDK
jgi:hypothetical protein